MRGTGTPHLGNEGGTVYTQDFNPVSDSLGLTAIFAALPVLTLFVLLGGLKMKAQWAALISLAVAMLVAMIVYSMPVDQTALSASEGAAFGLFPIMWIVVMAIALGFRPIKAASLALVANTAPVAFGAIAIPIVTLSEITGLDKGDLGAMVGRQTPFLALIVPLILIGMVDGSRGIRQAWPVAVVGGFAFALGQFVCSNFLSVELTDIVASLFSTACIVGFLRIWQPGEPLLAEDVAPAGRFQRPAAAGASVHDPAMEAQVKRRDDTTHDTTADVIKAYAPYAIIIVVFSIAQIPAVKNKLAESPWTTTFDWPGLDVRSPDGEPLSSLTFNFNWLPAAGTLMLISGLITMAVLGLTPARAVRVLGATLDQLKWAILTVASVLALAYVMNQAAQITTLGFCAAGAPAFIAFLSPLIGWLGVAVTGSDTSSNALFGGLQVAAAKDAGVSQTLLAAANSSGGVLGKMISPQNLAIGAAAAGLAGREGDLFRKVLGWSLVLMLAMCALVYLQSTAVLDWMVVK